MISKYLELIRLSLRQIAEENRKPTDFARPIFSGQKIATLIHSWASPILYFALRRSNKECSTKSTPRFRSFYSPPSSFFNDFLRLKMSFLTKSTKVEVLWTVYTCMSYTNTMIKIMLMKKKKIKKALSQFFSPRSLPALRNLLKMAYLS